MKKLLPFLLLCPFLLNGCLVYTLYPIFTDKDVYSDDRLLGMWMDSGNKPKVSFERSGQPDVYLASVYDDKGSIDCRVPARCALVKGKHFLCLGPGTIRATEAPCGQCNKLHLTVPVYYQCVLTLEDDRLTLGHIHSDDLDSWMKKHKVKLAISDAVESGDLVLEQTKKLQDIYQSYLRDGGIREDKFFRFGKVPATLTPVPEKK